MNTNANAYPAADPRSSTVAPMSTASSLSPLQRGKACIPCRRRKMKCDSARPVCTPCLRGERIEDCEYTDGPRRPRTLTLEEDIARLRARVEELENPEEQTSSIELYAPYTDASAGAGSASSASASVGQARVQAPSSASYYHGTGTSQALSHGPSSGQVDIEADVHLHARRALSVIAPHIAELGFFLNLDRLRVRGTQVLPALQSALTLWSIFITSTSDLNHTQSHQRIHTVASTLLSQAQTQLALALNSIDAEPDSAIVLHVIQTGVLLAYYMQRIGQVVGARYYASGAWALVIMLRLYRRPNFSARTREGEGHVLRGSGVREGLTHENTNTDANPCVLAFAWSARMAPALDGVEAEERVRAFWAVYALDRWFGVVCEVPCQSLAMDGSAGNVMTVPWPGVGGIVETRSNAVQHVLNDPSHDFMREGASAMHAKASVLLGEAMEIAASFVANPTISQSAAFRTRFGTLDALFERCLSAAMAMTTALNGRLPQTQEQTQALVTVHLIALAQVTLHRSFTSTYGPSRRRSIEGALAVVRVLDRVGEVGEKVGEISPIYGIVWTALCLALHDEVLRLRARPDADPSRRREEGELMVAIRKLVGILSTLSQRCPGRFFAANIEAVLPILGSIVV
ncbi:hypothetical protein J3R82DRAFT_8301 [Butyriboletus roseoflavus]|nr:hypothetical protein J3R82DRAFT_8301 [Butyriboletus roseoflavus]